MAANVGDVGLDEAGVEALEDDIDVDMAADRGDVCQSLPTERAMTIAVTVTAGLSASAAVVTTARLVAEAEAMSSQRRRGSGNVSDSFSRWKVRVDENVEEVNQ